MTRIFPTEMRLVAKRFVDSKDVSQLKSIRTPLLSWLFDVRSPLRMVVCYTPIIITLLILNIHWAITLLLGILFFFGLLEYGKRAYALELYVWLIEEMMKIDAKLNETEDNFQNFMTLLAKEESKSRHHAIFFVEYAIKNQLDDLYKKH